MSITVGLDIGKRVVDLCIRYDAKNTRHHRFENTPEGHQAILKYLKLLEVGLIVCEPTGGYERILCITLVKKGYKVHRVHTYSFSQFSKSIHLSKTDRQDAARLAYFGEIMNLTENFTIEDRQDQLKAYQSRREDLVLSLNKVKQRRDQLYDDAIEKSLKREIAYLEGEIERFDKLSADIIEQDTTLQEKVDILVTIPGIGKCIATKLIATLPELGSNDYDASKLSAMVGVAPYARDSGMRSGKRFIRGGRKMPRDAFYMAILSGRKKISHINGLYERIIAQGKVKKIAAVACMRKLIALAHSLLKHRKTFQVHT